MNLSKNMQSVLTKEIRFVAQKMRETNDPAVKLYFYSAIYGMAFRIMNFECDPELVFIHFVLNNSYTNINDKLSMLAQGIQRGIGVPDKLFEKLEEALEEMAAKIERGEETYPILQEISNLTYSTTGNGYYLYLKGLLSV